MSWSKSYERWNQAEQLDSELKKLLADAEGNEQMLEDFFYKNLEFGTGGMRGEIGPGTNRMNIYTVRKASAGLAAYIAKQGEDAKKEGLRSHTTPVINLLSLRWKLQKPLLPKAFKHTSLMSSARRLSCLLR